MKKELETTYDPGAIEERLYQKWLDNKYFHAEVDETKQPYTMTEPLENHRKGECFDRVARYGE